MAETKREMPLDIAEAIDQLCRLYPEAESWTITVSAKIIDSEDFRVKRVVYVNSEKAGYIDIEHCEDRKAFGEQTFPCSNCGELTALHGHYGLKGFTCKKE